MDDTQSATPPAGRVAFPQTAVLLQAEPICVSKADIAKMLAVSERTIAKWVQEGRIPYVKPNGGDGRLLFPVRAVRRHFEQMAVRAEGVSK